MEIICQTFSFVISDDSLQIGVRTVRENVCKLLITLLQNQGQLSVPSVVEETLLTHWRLLISKMEFYFSACSKIKMTLQVLLKNLENTFNLIYLPLKFLLRSLFLRKMFRSIVVYNGNDIQAHYCLQSSLMIGLTFCCFYRFFRVSPPSVILPKPFHYFL